MEHLKTLLIKTVKYILPFSDFTYISQLENYETKRLFKQLFSSPFNKFFKRDFQKHDSLQKTLRARLIIILSILIYISLLATTIYIFSNTLLRISLIIALTILIPIYIIISTSLTKTLQLLYIRDYKKTGNILKQNKSIQIIGITGSYGKTTTKYLLNDLLKYNYKVQYIPDNINTKIGISRWINKQLKQNTQYLIIEMGAYSRGEISKICKLTPPNIAVITALGDQHIERFGSIDNLIKAKTEIFNREESKKYINKNTFDKNNLKDYSNMNIVKENKDITGLNTQIHKDTLSITQAIAKDLNIKDSFITDTFKNFSPPSRRNDQINIQGLEIIDNSYNISPTVAANNIDKARELARKQNKDLIIITAGIPETGRTWKEDNYKLGEYISNTDLVLLNSVYHKDISRGYKKDPLGIFNSMKDALEFLKKENYQDKIILMLPELSDLSY